MTMNKMEQITVNAIPQFLWFLHWLLFGSAAHLLLDATSKMIPMSRKMMSANKRYVEMGVPVGGGGAGFSVK